MMMIKLRPFDQKRLFNEYYEKVLGAKIMKDE